jgi:nitrate reductase gamma subunit
MDNTWQTTPKDRFLAHCGAGCIGGSMLITLGFVFVLLFATNPAAALRDHPVGVLLTIAAAAAFVTSAASLSQLRRRSTAVEPRRLWRVSLLCHLGILAIAVIGFGVTLGVVLGIIEVICVGIHIFALAATPVPADDVQDAAGGGRERD